MIQIPSGQSMDELQKTIEFIQLVASSDNLNEILTQLSEAKEGADASRALIAADMEMLDERMEKAQTEAQKNLDVVAQAVTEQERAKALDAEARERISQAESKEVGLQNKVDEFAAYETKSLAAIEADESNLLKRINQLILDRNEAESLITEYTEKLAELKKIAG